MVQHSKTFVSFNYLCVGVALAMLGFSLFLMDVNLATKGYLAMGILFLSGSLVTLVKTLRDVAEGEFRASQLERAKNEKLLEDYAGKEM